MSSQDSRDNSSSGAVNRRNILLASTTLGVASALGSTALAQAQTAQEPVHIYGDNAQVRLSVAAQFPVRSTRLSTQPPCSASQGLANPSFAPMSMAPQRC